MPFTLAYSEDVHRGRRTERWSTKQTLLEANTRATHCSEQASGWFLPALRSARPATQLREQFLLLLPFPKAHFFLVTCPTNRRQRQKYGYKAPSKHFILLPSPKPWRASPALSDKIKQPTTISITFIFSPQYQEMLGRIAPHSSRAIFPGCHGNQAEGNHLFSLLSIWSV